MAKTSLAVHLQKYAKWAYTLAVPAQETPCAHAGGRSRSQHGLPACMGACSHHIVPMATLSDESYLDAQHFLTGNSGFSLPPGVCHCSDASVQSSLSFSDLSLRDLG